MKISVVTVAYNSGKTIKDTLQSVAAQLHPDVEHVIIDGGSVDDTLAVVRAHSGRVSSVVSEADDGIYDAMNKGFKIASGEIVCFLNSDDVYSSNHVLSQVSECFFDASVDFVYGDLLMLDNSGSVVRSWRTGQLSGPRLNGRQIPHPALFVRRAVLARISPCFDSSYRISADLKQQLLLVSKIGARGYYLPEFLVHMRVGGASTSGIGAYFLGWRESARAYNEVFGSGGFFYTSLKVFSKLKMVRKLW